MDAELYLFLEGYLLRSYKDPVIHVAVFFKNRGSSSALALFRENYSQMDHLAPIAQYIAGIHSPSQMTLQSASLYLLFLILIDETHEALDFYENSTHQYSIFYVALLFMCLERYEECILALSNAEESSETNFLKGYVYRAMRDLPESSKSYRKVLDSDNIDYSDLASFELAKYALVNADFAGASECLALVRNFFLPCLFLQIILEIVFIGDDSKASQLLNKALGICRDNILENASTFRRFLRVVIKLGSVNVLHTVEEYLSGVEKTVVEVCLDLAEISVARMEFDKASIFYKSAVERGLGREALEGLIYCKIVSGHTPSESTELLDQINFLTEGEERISIRLACCKFEVERRLGITNSRAAADYLLSIKSSLKSIADPLVFYELFDIQAVCRICSSEKLDAKFFESFFGMFPKIPDIQKLESRSETNIFLRARELLLNKRYTDALQFINTYLNARTKPLFYRIKLQENSTGFLNRSIEFIHTNYNMVNVSISGDDKVDFVLLCLEVSGIYLAQSSLVEAQDYLSKAKSIDPNCPEVMMLTCKIAASRGDYIFAVNTLCSVDASFNLFLEFNKFAAEIYLNNLRDTANYVNCYKKIAETLSTPESWLDYGCAVLKSENPEKASFAFSKFTSLVDPASLNASDLINILSILLESHEFELAVEFVRRVASKSPTVNIRLSALRFMLNLVRIEECEEVNDHLINIASKLDPEITYTGDLCFLYILQIECLQRLSRDYSQQLGAITRLVHERLSSIDRGDAQELVELASNSYLLKSQPELLFITTQLSTLRDSTSNSDAKFQEVSHLIGDIRNNLEVLEQSGPKAIQGLCYELRKDGKLLEMLQTPLFTTNRIPQISFFEALIFKSVGKSNDALSIFSTLLNDDIFGISSLEEILDSLIFQDLDSFYVSNIEIEENISSVIDVIKESKLNSELIAKLITLHESFDGSPEPTKRLASFCDKHSCDPRDLLNLIYCFWKSHNFAKAKGLFKRIYEDLLKGTSFNSSLTCLERFAVLYIQSLMDTSKIDQAKKILTEFVNIYPGSGVLQGLLFDVQFGHNELDDALRSLNTAIEILGETRQLKWRLAKWHQAAGNAAKTLQYLNSSLGESSEIAQTVTKTRISLRN
jgi:tetratricopeptide (TPR) repeat protein